jgi:hypothetical protein
MRAGGTFEPTAARVHSHRARYGGIALVRGAHTLTSLTGIDENALKALVERAAQDLRAAGGARVTDSSPRAARRAVLARALAEVRKRVLESAGEKLVCHDDDTAPNFVTLADTPEGHGGIFDRSGKIECKGFEFDALEKFTMFSFSKPNWDYDMAPFPQHTLILNEYRPVRACKTCEATSVTSRELASRAAEWYPKQGQYEVWDLETALLRKGQEGCHHGACVIYPADAGVG